MVQREELGDAGGPSLGVADRLEPVGRRGTRVNRDLYGRGTR
eukprot:COSAG04_NODE_15850_length_518_cov_1.174224_1_plen_41_part_10